MRQATTVANPTVPSIGNWVSAQTRPMVSNAQRVCTRLTIKPVTIAESENRRKKLEPIKPNSRGLRLSSFIIGTAAMPITALSAKLISMNRNNRAMISQASLGVSDELALAGPPRPGVSRTSAPMDREDWTLMGNSVQTPGTHPYPRSGTHGYHRKIGREKVRYPRSQKSDARAHPGCRVQGVHQRRLCRNQHARHRQARQ